MGSEEVPPATMPVVALAGTMAPDSLARARALGVADCVAKFDRTGLVAAVNEITSAPLDAAA